MFDCFVHSFLIQVDIKPVPLVDILQKHSVGGYIHAALRKHSVFSMFMIKYHFTLVFIFLKQFIFATSLFCDLPEINWFAMTIFRDHA